MKGRTTALMYFSKMFWDFWKLWKCHALSEISVNAIQINCILLKLGIKKKKKLWLGIYSKAYSTITVPKNAQIVQCQDTWELITQALQDKTDLDVLMLTS